MPIYGIGCKIYKKIAFVFLCSILAQEVATFAKRSNKPYLDKLL